MPIQKRLKLKNLIVKGQSHKLLGKMFICLLEENITPACIPGGWELLLCVLQEERGQSPQSRSSTVRSRQEDGFTKHWDECTNASMYLRSSLWYSLECGSYSNTALGDMYSSLGIIFVFVCTCSSSSATPSPPSPSLSSPHPFSSSSPSPPSTPLSLLRHGRLVLWGHPLLCSSLSQDWVGCTGNTPICWLFAKRIHCALNKISGWEQNKSKVLWRRLWKSKFPQDGSVDGNESHT